MLTFLGAGQRLFLGCLQRVDDKGVGMAVTHVEIGRQERRQLHVVNPEDRMIDFHSSIDIPYFFSIDGRYDAGPRWGSVTSRAPLLCIRPTRR
jgi:hypothetical protein